MKLKSASAIEKQQQEAGVRLQTLERTRVLWCELFGDLILGNPDLVVLNDPQASLRNLVQAILNSEGQDEEPAK